ncbi:LuxR C-terminal-related transcriptional regulator [Streptomyces sp. NPDC090077]|uniref:response regulator transcription factor n=1 Tax=Streptomyces sp. NPDC090077 TaxID=3365938 RepID=UPI0037F89308
MISHRERTIGIVIADDHALVREAVSVLLSCEPDLEVVAQASDGPTAVRAAAARRADVVLLAASLTGPGTGRLLGELRIRAPQAKVVLLLEHEEDDPARTPPVEGAFAHVRKSAPSQALLDAIRAAVLEPPADASAALPDEQPGQAVLTDREREVLCYVSQALSNRQIGTKLTITEGTVKRHLQNIFAKLNARSRIDAVNKSRGVLGPPQPRVPAPREEPRTQAGERTPQNTCVR